MQQTDRIAEMIIRTKGIGTDQFSAAAGLVRGCHALGPHFVQDDGHARFGGLPSGLGSGETGADDMDRCRHPRDLGL
ncbi:hypothetical protein GCM10007854_11980 [Algimonas porphyrae]|uniref:Uncharacterized protein n=1 Tax=Algimonas porphyrae TaxID=1128113 RepID=A0ABQ5V099_9PROT|nr:hypothetical protein GCM10007854_11980 [Algimonas porphyrae]